MLAEEPTVSAQLAAYELQYHLEKMSGATLPIVREPETVAGAVVLVWAFGELFEALGDVIDLFKDNTDPDLPAETMGISIAPCVT